LIRLRKLRYDYYSEDVFMAMTAKEHNRLAGIFLLAHGGLHLLALLFIGVIYGGIGSVFLVSAKKDEEQIIGAIFLGFAVLILSIGSIFAGIQLIAGWKMLKEKPNARTWGIVANIMVVVSFPLGTAVGIHGLWFLFGDLGKTFYLQNDANRNFLQPPPPPNSWQQ
jgi:hypothetical protein